jgi:hypothetical protein
VDAGTIFAVVVESNRTTSVTASRTDLIRSEGVANAASSNSSGSSTTFGEPTDALLCQSSSRRASSSY